MFIPLISKIDRVDRVILVSSIDFSLSLFLSFLERKKKTSIRTSPLFIFKEKLQDDAQLSNRVRVLPACIGDI